MIVDAFAVAGGYPVRPVKLGLEQLRASMHKNGVDQAMTMSLRAIQHDAALGNRDICEAAARDPRILPVAIVDPRDSLHVEQVIESAVTDAAVALAFHTTAIPCPLNSILFRRSLTRAAASGLPMIFVVNSAGQLTQIAEMTHDRGCPKVLLAGASYHHLGELMALLEAFGHIYVETSYQVSPGAIALLEGADQGGRVLFGSMAPLRPVRPALNMIADAELAAAVKVDILARNALRFLGRQQQAASVDEDVPAVHGIPTTPAIDVHCHVRVTPHQPSTCLGPAETVKELKRFNIERAVVSATEGYKDDIDVGNRQMMDAVKRFDRLLGSVVVNPHHPAESIRWLDVASKDRQIVHVTVNPLSTYERYGSPGWMQLFAEVAARRLPVFYNTGGQDIYRRSPAATEQGHLFRVRGAAPDEVDMFQRISQAFPDLVMILGHGHGLEGLALARSCKNIYLDLCSSYPEQDVYGRAVEAVGADRVVFGTDLELFSPAFVLGSLWEAGLDDQQLRCILHDNACRILPLS